MVILCSLMFQRSTRWGNLDDDDISDLFSNFGTNRHEGQPEANQKSGHDHVGGNRERQPIHGRNRESGNNRKHRGRRRKDRRRNRRPKVRPTLPIVWLQSITLPPPEKPVVVQQPATRAEKSSPTNREEPNERQRESKQRSTPKKRKPKRKRDFVPSGQVVR